MSRLLKLPASLNVKQNILLVIKISTGLSLISPSRFMMGLLRNSLIAPAVSLTFAYTRTSQMMYVFSDSTAEAWAKLKLSTLSLHVDISKNLLLITPYAGIGWDWHEFNASWEVDYVNPLMEDDSGGMDLKPSSRRLYAGVELCLVIIHLNLEGGLTGGNGFVAAGARIGF